MGKFPIHPINPEGVVSLDDFQQFAFGGGIVELGSIEYLTVDELRKSSSASLWSRTAPTAWILALVSTTNGLSW